MSSIIVKVLSGGRSKRRAAMKQHTRKYNVGFGVLLKTSAGMVAIYSKQPVPDYFSWIWKHKPAGHIIFVARHFHEFIVVICSDDSVQLCAMKSLEQAMVLLEGQDSANQLFVCPTEDLAGSPFKELAHRKGWQVKPFQMRKLSTLRPARSLIPTSPFALALPLIPGLVAFHLLSTPEPDVIQQEAPDPYFELKQQLTSSPGRMTPLLRLDYNYLYLFEGIPGWNLSEVEYSTQGVLYTLENVQGSYQKLRDFAHELSMSVRFSSGTAYLTKPLNLPVAFAAFEPSMLINQQQLIATLHDRIGEWVPAAQLILQQEQRTEYWAGQRALIQFNGLFPNDLLTLAGLLEDMTLKFEHGKYRINNGQLTGNILVTLYGAAS